MADTVSFGTLDSVDVTVNPISPPFPWWLLIVGGGLVTVLAVATKDKKNKGNKKGKKSKGKKK